jgi:hypothetical protein
MTLANIAPGKRIRASHMLELQEMVEGFQDQLDALPGVDQLENIRAGIYNVLDYEAVGDGVTDDRASVQLALDAIYAAGGGTLYFPDGDYLIGLRDTIPGGDPNFYISFSGVHLFVYGSNVTITGSPNARILIREGHANSTCLFYGIGGLRTPETVETLTDIPTWTSEVYWFNTAFANYPIYEIDPADEGDGSIVLTDPADTANFSVGNGICIRSGQTLGTAGEAQPDGETNQITAIDVVTGEMTLLFPLAKGYVQEYFPDSGRDEATTTSVTAFPAYLGVQNIENHIARNMVIDGLNIDVDQEDGHLFVFMLHSALHSKVVNNYVRGKNCSTGYGASYRDLLYANNKFYLNQTLSHGIWFGADRCCGDFQCVNNFFYGDGDYPSIFHLNEGSFGGIISGNHVINAPVSNANHALSIRARGYNYLITDNYFQFNNPSGSTVYIDETVVNALMANNMFTGSSGALNVSVPGRALGNLGNVGNSDGLTLSDAKVASKWLYHDSPATIDFAEIPPGAYVLRCEVQVFEEFDGASASVNIGWSFFTYFLDATSLTTKGVFDNRTNFDLQYYQQSGAGPRLSEIRYTADGSAVGKALIVMEWAQVEAGIGV